jgi:hypothetical protein
MMGMLAATKPGTLELLPELPKGLEKELHFLHARQKPVHHQ